MAQGARSEKSIAVELLHALAALLRFDGQCCRWARNQAGQANRLAGFFAPAKTAVINHTKRFVYFFQQFALTITGSQLKGVLLFLRGAIGWVRRDFGVTQVFASVGSVVQDAASEFNQFFAEELELLLTHVIRFGLFEYFRLG